MSVGPCRLRLALALALAACAWAVVPLASGAATTTGGSADKGAPPLGVQIVIARPGPDSRSLTLTGEILGRHMLPAGFPTAGRITALLVSQGDAVTAGEVLARVDSVQQAQALRAAEAALGSARAALVKARDDAQRQDQLLQRGATTRSARDAAADRLRAAQAGVAQAVADRDRAQRALDDTVLRAPGAGRVTARMAEVGQVVGVAQPVLELALGDRYDAIFHVPEAMLTSVPAALPPVVLAPLGRPKETFRGKVREIAPIVDARTGTVKVTVTVLNKPADVNFGDAVLGTIDHPEPARISLPWTAITATAAGPAVWIVDPASGRVALRQVEIARYESGHVILAGGLRPGDEVVGLGSQLLYPGRVVTGVAAP